MNNQEPINKITSDLAPKVYDDLIAPGAREVGQVAARTVKALLAPIRGMLWGWEKIESYVENNMENKLQEIPEQFRKTPDPEIAVPIMQALTYTIQNETLRELYFKLLGNSMDARKEMDVHPSYVEIIKQMNSLDAKLLYNLSRSIAYQPVINPRIILKDKKRFIPGATPYWFLGLTIDNYNLFDISASLIRLSKFGLIDLLYENSIADYNEKYNTMKNHSDLKAILDLFRNTRGDEEIQLSFVDSLLYVNEYGQQFKNVCID